MPSPDDAVLDKAFELLNLATALEGHEVADEAEENVQTQLSARKYFEACRILHTSMPSHRNNPATYKLILEKLQHYKVYARELLLNRANKILENVLNIDEHLKRLSPQQICAKRKIVIESYIEVADFYVSSVKLIEDHNDWMGTISRDDAAAASKLFKMRLNGIFDRIKALKSIGSNESSSNNDISAQQRTAPTPHTAAGIRGLTSEEIAVLKKSSLISSGLFMPWDKQEALSFSADAFLSKSPHPKQRWKDPDGLLELSKSQNNNGFYKWARPSEIISMKRMKCKPVMIRSISPYLIKQTCVTDCSFIASLCICAAFERRFKKKLVTSLIYPQDRNGTPIFNPLGKYLVKFWLNGIERSVYVDDYFPVDRNGRLLCSHTSYSNCLEMWVPIIEKAYMKLCGGYDFPGSNSGVDMFSLTGWIPEQIFFVEDNESIKDFQTPPERAWERLKSASSFGDCLITASASRNLSEEEAKSVGLITAHAYAVLSVVETKNGIRLLQLKNPWMKGSWKGRYCSSDWHSWTQELQAEVGYNPKQAIKVDDGVFWICWRDMLKYFSNLFLSWNPALFPHRVTVHGSWLESQGPENDVFNIGENPQYILSLSDIAVRQKASIWILLSRHVTKQEQEGQEPNDFLTLHVYRSQRNRNIWYPGGRDLLLNGAYTNNQHVLSRVDISGEEDRVLSLVLSQHKKANDLNYTFSVFCTKGDFKLYKTPKLPSINNEISSSWTSTSSGGAPGKGFFGSNPMWIVKVPPGGAQMHLRCSTEMSLPVNLMLQNQKYISRVKVDPYKTPAFETGDYRKAFVATELATIQEGSYILVASTYYPGARGAFVTNISSSVPIVIKEIPIFDELYKHSFSGRWAFASGTACGSPNHGIYGSNPMYLLSKERRNDNECYVYVKLDLPSKHRSKRMQLGLNVSCFECIVNSNGSVSLPRSASPAGKSCALIASSNNGVYVTGRPVDLAANLSNDCKHFAVVPSTFEPHEIEFELTFCISSKMKLSALR